MCGVSAYYSFEEKIDNELFKKFTDVIKHRGTDGYGYFFNNNNTVALGHRRLSIIDLSDAGKQPMHYMNNRYTIAYNGEVFNYKELKIELQSKGYSFFSNTDTEVILAAYSYFGANCVNKFNGMWAFVIYDNIEKTFFVSRDRFGIKPLYYYHDKKKFIAASETPAFDVFKNLNLSYNYNGISNELYQPVYLEGNNQTKYNEIICLPAGHNLIIYANGNLEVTKWWKAEEQKIQVPTDFKDQVVAFKELFYSAINLRLRSDVPIGTALSGGVDSSSIYCALNDIVKNDKLNNKKQLLKAYVATFTNFSNDETKYALKVIQQYKNEYKLIEIDYNNLAKKIEENIKLTGIITGTSLFPISNLYSNMKTDSTTVSLDGHGADEQLYGYTWLVLAAQHDAAKKRDKALNASLIDCYLNLFEPSRREEALTHLYKINKPIKYIAKLILKKNKNKIDQDMWQNKNFNITYKNAEELLIENFSVTSLPSILRNFDRSSMQSGIEIRMPFMDYRLVSFLNSIPLTSKLGSGYTKLILREAMKNLVPDSIRLRTYKLGINAPVYEWFNDALQSWLFDVLASNNFTNSPFFDGKKIYREVEKEFKNGNISVATSNKLWPYLSASFIL